MFTHSYLGTNDVPASRKFYTAIMKQLGYDAIDLPHGTLFSSADHVALIVATPANGEKHCVSNGHTLGFTAKSYDEVDAWHKAGLESGGTDFGAPGFRANSPGNMYGAYLLDPDGNKICAFTPNVGER